MSPLFRRYVQDVQESPTQVTFTLVLRDWATKQTYGAKQIVVAKPLTVLSIRQAVQQAVNEMVNQPGQAETIVRAVAYAMDLEGQ